MNCICKEEQETNVSKSLHKKKIIKIYQLTVHLTPLQNNIVELNFGLDSAPEA